MKKLVFALMFCILLTSMVSASQDSLGIFEKNKDITLLQVCGTCTYNNITSIVLPNSTHLPLDASMTKRGAEYTYTFSQTDLTGVYLVSGFGDLDGTDNAWAYEFEVTGSGQRGISIEWVLVIAMIIAGVLIVYGFSQEEHPPITIGAILLLMISLYIWMNGFGSLGAKDLISQFIAAAMFIVGATLTIKSLGGD